MDSAPNATPQGEPKLAFELKEKNGLNYSINLSISEKKLLITITNIESVGISTYSHLCDLEELKKLNRYFRIFDEIDEVIDYFIEKELPKNCNVEIESNFAKFIIKIEEITKSGKGKNLELVIPGIELKEKDLILKLCEKVNELSIMKKKVDFLINANGFEQETFEEIYKKIEGTQVIESIGDLIVVAKGIRRKLGKKIKGMNLLYRASADGDASTKFHEKCNGKENTITFVKTTNNFRFGGFAHQPWNSNGNYFNDEFAFIFSLDRKTFYSRNGNGNDLYGNNGYGPTWGAGHDLHIANGCLTNKNSYNNTSSYNWKNDSYFLTGESKFQVKDYEVYQVDIE